MVRMMFREKLGRAIERNDSLLCVGLDSEMDKLPSCLPRTPDGVLEFNKRIIDSTKDLVCAYKPNSAFYEMLGAKGVRVLAETIRHVPREIPVILDAKRGDIGNTAKAYARAAFEVLKADAITASPYLGYDSLEPFLAYEDRAVFVLCRTSNRSAGDIQDLGGARKVYIEVAMKAVEWDARQNLGLVVGATYPEELAEVRGLVGEEMPLLIPGVSSQGGDMELAVRNGANSSGSNAIINSSRGIIFADGTERFAEAARAKALEARDAMNRFRKG